MFRFGCMRDVQLHASPSLIPSLPCHSERSEESPLFAERKGVRGDAQRKEFRRVFPFTRAELLGGLDWITLLRGASI